ncbi:UPF0489 family protein [Paenibacillus sp. LK1]|uniref:UPF0489 family protein n=1 Tax=Paenibacillus sp. LK1 TaxID=2053014 RepID=UPI000C1882C7|nr:UPF0489 family protein [Paenibacillus sp. LK1]PIH59123.1 hypothetical protein CS562_14385 [Paenibacillus sp. LK1]
MRILDIDLDLFLYAYDGLSHDREDNNNVPFEEERVRQFLEKRCGLSKEKPIEGVLVQQHHEAFLYWEELVEAQRLTVPFEVVHADMHSDLYTMSYTYILGELMHESVGNRVGKMDKSKLHFSNYLVFALACGWINHLTYVTHYDWDDNDGLSDIYFRDFNPESGLLHLAAYNPSEISSYSNFTENKIKSDKNRLNIPFNTIDMDDYQNTVEFDFVVLCRSKEYTPEESDKLIPVIMEYIKVI